MKSRIITFIISTLLLAACASQSVAPTATATISPTTTFTPIPAPTATPTPAYPAFDQQSLEQWGLSADNLMAWQDQDGKWWAGEKQGDKKLTIGESKDWELVVVELAPEIVSAAQEFFGSEFKIGQDGSVFDKIAGKPISEFKIAVDENGIFWMLSFCHPVEGNADFCETVAAADLKVGQGRIETPAQVYEKGVFVRKTVAFDGAKGEKVRMNSLSVQEFWEMVRQDSSSDPKLVIDNHQNLMRLFNEGLKIIARPDGFHIKWGG